MPRKKKISVFAQALPGMSAEERGRKAQEALDNPIFTAARDIISNQIFNAQKVTPVLANQDREVLYLRYEAMQKFVNQLEGFINEAKLDQILSREKGESNG